LFFFRIILRSGDPKRLAELPRQPPKLPHGAAAKKG
jgi:hypothetical protein